MTDNYYITPQGKAISLGNGSHFVFVREMLLTADPLLASILTESEKAKSQVPHYWGQLNSESERFVYDIMEQMLQRGWVRVTGQDDVNRLAIQGKWNRIREERQFLEDLIAAENVDYVDFGIVREHGEDIRLGASQHDINMEGLIRTLNDQRRIGGFLATDVFRRPRKARLFRRAQTVHVRRHRRRR